MEKNTSITLFEHLPTEILFDIFDYLSCNDAVYAFFYLNERLKNSLIQHRHILHCFQLPISNLSYWQNVLPMIESEIQTLKVTNVKLSLSLNLFVNLTSLIICTPDDLCNRDLNFISQSEQFKTLKILKIQTTKMASKEIPPNTIRSDGQMLLLQKVFNNGNLLQTFEYRSLIHTISPNFFYVLNFNPHIQSLTLHLVYLIEALYFIQYTPNLKYLNIEVEALSPENKEYQWPKVKRIKLEKFFVAFKRNISCYYRIRMDTQKLKSILKQFSSSLTCLSLYFAEYLIDPKDDFLLNGPKLREELLESLIHLKDFYLYVN